MEEWPVTQLQLLHKVHYIFIKFSFILPSSSFLSLDFLFIEVSFLFLPYHYNLLYYVYLNYPFMAVNTYLSTSRLLFSLFWENEPTVVFSQSGKLSFSSITVVWLVPHLKGEKMRFITMHRYIYKLKWELMGEINMREKEVQDKVSESELKMEWCTLG